MSLLPTLQNARDALRAGDLGAARDLLIAEWRVRRSPVIAEIVAVIASREPDALGKALATLVTPRTATSLANLKALGRVEDPRLSAFAIDSLVRLPFTATTARDFLVALAKTAERHHDPRLATRVTEIRDAVTTRIGRLAIRQDVMRIVDRAVANLPPVRPPSTHQHAIETELLALVEPMRTETRSADALLAEIYANPADDAPRLVYADLLLAQGDPRGELIVLQIERARRNIDEPSEREQELLKKHGKAWLGELAPVLSWGKGYACTAFRRGFVAEADIILSVGKKLRPILRNPAWATIEMFHSSVHDLLLEAPLRGLRDIRINGELLPRLAARAEKLTGVTRLELTEPPGVPSTLRAAFPRLQTLAGVCMTITAVEHDAYTACGIDHVELIHRWREPSQLADAMSALEAFATSLVGTRARVARLTLRRPFTVRSKPTEPIELHRDGNGRYARMP